MSYKIEILSVLNYFFHLLISFILVYSQFKTQLLIFVLVGSVVIDTGPHRGDIPSPLQYKASIRPLPLVESLKLQDELIDADIKYGNFAFCHPFTNTLNILF